MSDEAVKSGNFIRDIINTDNESGKYQRRVHTRFPPEPNGYLHIGHAKSICLNFGIAESYPGGKCNLRFDDTNPTKEEDEYVNSIIEDVRWLGFDWENRLFFASDYFEQMYTYAVQLIKSGKAYVDDLTADEIRGHRGTLTKPGIESPWRERTVEENLQLFEAMRAGKFANGQKVLRAKIDMKSPNLNMRDPVMYRILHAAHHRTGDQWCIYPMYDWAHGIEDSLERITHSICTLEFEDHRPLYDWFLEALDAYRPQQIEFARLNLNYTVMSKRKLLKLVKEKFVDGWDDPRMPTLSGMRRRGYTAQAIRDFAEIIGVSKSNSTVDISLLEHCLRDDLNKRALRVMVVLDPLKITITNYPGEQVEQLEAENNPENAQAGIRKIPFSREIFIEREDFREDAPSKWFRLAPGKEVRLKHAYYITCTEVIKDDSGLITELKCTYDPLSKGGWAQDGRKVKGTLHWVSAEHSIPAEVRMYDHLFLTANPEDTPEGQDFTVNLNPKSLEILTTCRMEPGLAGASAGERYQFLRKGYFCLDPKHSQPGKLVFNQTTGLKDSWAKIEENKR